MSKLLREKLEQSLNFEYIETTHHDGSVQHIYDPSLNPLVSLVDAVIEDYLKEYDAKVRKILIHEVIKEQLITVNCEPTDDLPSILSTFLLTNLAPLIHLHYVPSTGILAVGTVIKDDSITPTKQYEVSGSLIVEVEV